MSVVIQASCYDTHCLYPCDKGELQIKTRGSDIIRKEMFMTSCYKGVNTD